MVTSKNIGEQAVAKLCPHYNPLKDKNEYFDEEASEVVETGLFLPPILGDFIRVGIVHDAVGFVERNCKRRPEVVEALKDLLVASPNLESAIEAMESKYPKDKNGYYKLVSSLFILRKLSEA